MIIVTQTLIPFVTVTLMHRPVLIETMFDISCKVFYKPKVVKLTLINQLVSTIHSRTTAPAINSRKTPRKLLNFTFWDLHKSLPFPLYIVFFFPLFNLLISQHIDCFCWNFKHAQLSWFDFHLVFLSQISLFFLIPWLVHNVCRNF